MRPFEPRFPTRAMLVAILACSAAAGCAKKATAPGPPGDDGGEHLLVFVTDRSGTNGGGDIALYDLDQAGFRSVAGLNGASAEREPSLTDDGSFVAFESDRSGAGDVFVYDRLNQVLLTTPGLDTPAREGHPRFTHDSSKLVFSRDSSGISRIRLYDPSTGGLIPLPGIDAPGAAFDDQGAPNVDGSRIAFVSNRSGRQEVYVWNRGTGVTQPAGLAGDSTDEEPSLSSNGRWLTFSSNRTGGAGGYDVYLYDLQSSAMVTLTSLNSISDDRHPSVSADGSVLVFQSDRTGGAGQNDLYHYVLSTHVVDQSPGMRSAGDDRQPYLRWR